MYSFKYLSLVHTTNEYLIKYYVQRNSNNWLIIIIGSSEASTIDAEYSNISFLT